MASRPGHRSVLFLFDDWLAIRLLGERLAFGCNEGCLLYQSWIISRHIQSCWPLIGPLLRVVVLDDERHLAQSPG